MKFTGKFIEFCKRLVKYILYYRHTPDHKNSKIFEEIYHDNVWDTEESRSGGGSTFQGTQAIREALPRLLQTYKINTMLDIPCGDYNWMQHVKKTCTYIGADIVPALIQKNTEKYAFGNISFHLLDLTKDKLPKVDLVFCKDCLQHLSNAQVKDALRNIKRSESTWLLVTSYPLTLFNYDIESGGYRALNLFRKPFSLAKPTYKIEEKVTGKNIEVDKTMYLLRIKDLPDF